MSGLKPLPPTCLHSTSQPLTHPQAHSFLSTFLFLSEINAAYRPDSTLDSVFGPVSSIVTKPNPNLVLQSLKRILLGLEGKTIGVKTPEPNGDALVARRDGDGQEQQQQEVDVNAELGRFFGDDAAKAGVGGRPRPSRQKRKFDDDDKGGNQQRKKTNNNQKKVGRQRLETGQNHTFEEDGYEAVAVGNGATGTAVNGQQEWQDKEQYEHAQEDLNGDGEIDLHNEDRNPGAGLQQPRTAAEADDMMGVEIAGTGEKVLPSRTDGNDRVDKEARKKAKLEKRKQEKREKQEALRALSSQKKQ